MKHRIEKPFLMRDTREMSTNLFLAVKTTDRKLDPENEDLILKIEARDYPQVIKDLWSTED